MAVKTWGGGLLKAGAADLNQFPIDFEFNDTSSILDVYHILIEREAADTMEEIDTEEHTIIDDFVFNY